MYSLNPPVSSLPVTENMQWMQFCDKLFGRFHLAPTRKIPVGVLVYTFILMQYW